MKPTMRDIENVLKRDRGHISHQDVTDAASRAWLRLGAGAGRLSEPPPDHAASVGTRRWPTWLAAAASLAMAVGIGTVVVWGPWTSPATGIPTFEVVEGDVRVGETIRSSAAGAVLALADSSRIEMRALSELALERADDGVRIRLSQGGIIVNAAKQHGGHLFVQTKDVTVSVVGTVFLVNAEEHGSRVAVIEGEVRVQQGGTAKRLLSGEQFSTNPSMEARTVNDVIAWSLNSEALRALLQQSAVAPTALSPQASAEPRATFEVASIRPRPSPAGGGRGTSGSPCVGRGEIDPRRFAVTNTTLHELIAWAHGRNCIGDADLISGGPGWIRSDRFDLEARMPEGFPSYTMIQVRSGSAPKLQPMLQALLVERFKLAVRREMRERAVYVLTATDTPKLTPWRDGDGEANIGSLFQQSNPSGQIFARLRGTKWSMARLADALGQSPAAGRVVLDRTGIAGEFNVDLQFVPGEAFIATIAQATGAPPNVASGPSLSTALEEQLGLRLEAIRAPVETLTVEHAEKPSEN
ncbi:MAG: TIGR03435 family protein [Vicinamibacterales bacterium]